MREPTYQLFASCVRSKRSNVEAAQAVVEKLVGLALPGGWTRKPRGAGFKARPDAFDAARLPVAVKAKSKK